MILKTSCAHDKIEFDIAITTYSFDIDSKLGKLLDICLTQDECNVYKSCLQSLTLSHIEGSSSGSINYAFSSRKP